MQSLLRRAAAAAGLLLAFNAAAAAAPATSPQTAAGADTGANQVTVTGSNVAGDMTGFYTDDHLVDHGFIMLHSVATALVDPDGKFGTHPTGIDAAGDVVGYYFDKDHVVHGFVCRGGAFSTIDMAEGVHGTFPAGINDHGQVVGWVVDGDWRIHGFLYQDAQYSLLAPRWLPRGSWADAVDDHGAIVGVGATADGRICGFRLLDGKTTIFHGPGSPFQIASVGFDRAGRIILSGVDEKLAPCAYACDKGKYVRVSAPALDAASAPTPSSLAATDNAPKPILVLQESPFAPGDWPSPAKFALYDDGSVYYDNANETSTSFPKPDYYREKLSRLDLTSLLASFGANAAIGDGDRKFGRDDNAATWKVIYWPVSGASHSVTVVGSVADAPADMQKLIYALDQYPRPILKYTDFNYHVEFGTDVGQSSIPWPDNLPSVQFPNEMLVGESPLPPAYVKYMATLGGKSPYANIIDVRASYDCSADPEDGAALAYDLAKAKTDTVLIGKYAWSVSVLPDVRLPNQDMWWKAPFP